MKKFAVIVAMVSAAMVPWWPKWDDHIDYGMSSIDDKHTCSASLDENAKTNFENCLCSASYSIPLIGHVAQRHWSPTMPNIRTMNPYSFVEWAQHRWKVCDAALDAPIWPFHGYVETYRCSDHPDCIPPGGTGQVIFDLDVGKWKGNTHGNGADKELQTNPGDRL